MKLLRKLASLKLTLVGMTALGLAALAVAGESGIAAGFTAIPICVLVVNLAAALLTNRSFRTQTGLLVFHVGLLLVFLLAGLTVLTRFEGHVEVVQGGGFESELVEVTQSGWWHGNRLDQVAFTQERIKVDYLPQLLRQDTRSTILVRADKGKAKRITIGDRETTTIAGYRFAATFNKGFAVIVGWRGDDGRTGYGSIHFPSYPELDWNQRIDWTTPAGETLSLELNFDEPPLRAHEAWTLGGGELPFTLRIGNGDQAVLTAGDAVAVVGGQISVRDLRLWMGYRIDYLPLLPWMLVAAFIAIGGLAMHYRLRYLRPSTLTAPVRVARGDRINVATA